MTIRRAPWMPAPAPKPKERLMYSAHRWRQDGCYHVQHAVRVFRSESQANRYCDRENDLHPEWGRTGLVVRSFYPTADDIAL